MRNIFDRQTDRQAQDKNALKSMVFGFIVIARL